jgi:hypothetical protein
LFWVVEELRIKQAFGEGERHCQRA